VRLPQPPVYYSAEVERERNRLIEQAEELYIKSDRNGQVNGTFTADHLDMLGTPLAAVDETITVTVGTGGDYSTINEALGYLARRRPAYTKGGLNASGLNAEISLLTGFVMEEQVFVHGLDLGWITLTSVDAEVTIARDALTAAAPGPLSGFYPAFAFHECSVSPRIDALFVIDTSGAGTLQTGFQFDRSVGYFKSGAGCKNATTRGLHVTHGSVVYAGSTIWSGAGTIGARVANSSVAVLSSADVTGCQVGLSASQAYVQASLINASDATSIGINAQNANVLANEATITDATTDGVRSEYMADVDVRDATITDAGVYGVRAQFGGRVNADGSTLSGTSGPLIALTSSRVSAIGADCSTGKIEAREGSYINASSAEATFLHVRTGATIIGHSATLSSGRLGGTGTTKPPNVVNADGLITSADITENSGTATIPDTGTTFIDVLHGLTIAPTVDDITATPTNNMGTATHFWLSNVDTDSFRINVDAAPGATTATFAWRVRTV
jgi:hypothetical protein